MNEHTQGKLFHQEGFNTLYTFYGGGEVGLTIAIANTLDHQVKGRHEEASANARRLAACWNACAGFETGALEQLPEGETILTRLQEWQKDCIDAQVQRDDLLAACKAVMDEYKDGYGLNCVEQVSAAISKCEVKP